MIQIRLDLIVSMVSALKGGGGGDVLPRLRVCVCCFGNGMFSGTVQVERSLHAIVEI